MMPFYPHPVKSVIADELLDFATSTGDWHSYFNFSVAQVPFDIVFKDPLLKAVGSKYALAMGILRLDPYLTYDWHVDTKRGVCINMLLNDVKSNCLFSVGETEATHGFVELEYQPKTYYAFNNQVPHMVINFAEPRYLMSVEFQADKNELTYETFLKEELND
jgi:hypothetical protein